MGWAYVNTRTMGGGVAFTEVRAYQTSPQQFPGRPGIGCVGLFNKVKRLYASACTDRPFTVPVDLSAARAVGSLRAKVYRSGTGTFVGTTTLRYDVAWTPKTSPVPPAFASAMACRDPRIGSTHKRASLSSMALLAAYASTTGTVSSPLLGTIRFPRDTALPLSGIAEFVGHDASVDFPRSVTALHPSCLGV